MKPVFLPLFILLFSLLFCSVSCKNERPRPQEPESTREIQGGSGGETPRILSGGPDYSSLVVQTDPDPRLPPGPNETLLRVMDVNLDSDRQEEQILVLREKNSVDSFLYLAVLDYDNVFKDYRRVWEGPTEITSIRGFTVYLADLVGDHTTELVCTGMGPGGRQSMTVFRKNQEGSGAGLSYTPIFNHQARGTIEILEMPRTAAYEAGTRDGQSFPIITTIQDPDSDSMTDLLKNTYYWDFASRQYIKVKEEKILGRQLEQDQLLNIYRSEDQVFLEHINGPWMKNDGSGIIIDIDRAAGRLSFFTQEDSQRILDLYIWTSTYRLLNNVIMVSGENELVNHYERVVNIRIVDLNNLQITVQDIDTQTRARIPNDQWTGQYFFLSREIRNSLTRPGSPRPVTHVPSGKYTGDLGEEMTFSGNHFEFLSPAESFSGGFSVFNTGDDIFSLNILNNYGIPREHRVYRYTFEERTLEKTIQRTLILDEGRLLIHGFESFDKPPLRFQQIEIIDE